MDETGRIYDLVTDAYVAWKELELTEGQHMLCPKIGDDDDEDYVAYTLPVTAATIEDKANRTYWANKRVEQTYDASMLLGLSRSVTGDWVDKFVKGIEYWLTKCDTCILYYHMHRRKFLKRLRE